MDTMVAMLAAIFFFVMVGGDPDSNEIHHEDIKVQENQTVTMYCPGFQPKANTTESSIKWFKDKTLVAIFQNSSGRPFIGFPKYHDRSYFEASNSSVRDSGLVINPASQMHEGLYRCEIKTDSNMHKASLLLHVTVPDQGPVITGLDAPLSAKSSPILACSMEVDSNTDVFVSWFFHDNNSTTGEMIRRQVRYGVDRITSINQYSIQEETEVNDVTCVISVDNITFIATHSVNILTGASSYEPQVHGASATSLCWLFGLISLVMFLLFLFREWQWRRYVKKIESRIVREVAVPTGFNIKTIMFPGLQGGKPFFNKSTSVKSNASHKTLLPQIIDEKTVSSDTEESPPVNGVQKLNGHILNQDMVTIQNEKNKADSDNNTTISQAVKLRNSLDPESNDSKHTSSSDC